MIITGTKPLEIGKIYSDNNLDIPFEFDNKVVEKFAFKVIREANKKEFLEYVACEHPEMYSRIRICEYFYEIQTD